MTNTKRGTRVPKKALSAKRYVWLLWTDNGSYSNHLIVMHGVFATRKAAHAAIETMGVVSDISYWKREHCRIEREEVRS